jgi:hypothetical protein
MRWSGFRTYYGMNIEVLGLLFTVGLVGLVLSQAIKRLERALAEAQSNQHRAAERISHLERELASLKKSIRT